MSDEEWRSAVAEMDDTARDVACGHLVRVHGRCIDCGDGGDE